VRWEENVLNCRGQVNETADERAPLQISTSLPWTNSERYRPNSRVSGLERAAQAGYRSTAWSLSASWTVSSAAGSASKRSSGMGAPVRIDRP
jgi:hypothetical protein